MKSNLSFFEEWNGIREFPVSQIAIPDQEKIWNMQMN